MNNVTHFEKYILNIFIPFLKQRSKMKKQKNIVRLIVVLGGAFLICNTVVAQIPKISYANSTLNFTAGVAITPLSPINTGGLVTYAPAKITTIAGNPIKGLVDAKDTAARFNNPYGIAVDTGENIYVADGLNNAIRKITPFGLVSTITGSNIGGAGGFDVDGALSVARFAYVWGLALDSKNNIYVTDYDNRKVRKIKPTSVSTLAGNGTIGSTDGNGKQATFKAITGIALDQLDNVYVTDLYNNNIRKITPAGLVTTLAGKSGTFGAVDGIGSVASFSGPRGIVVDTAGNVFVADQLNNKIRKITPAGVVTTFAGSGLNYNIDGIGKSAAFNAPYGMTMDAVGNIYVSETNNIRIISPSGSVTTIPDVNVGMNYLAIDTHDNLFATINSQNLIKKIVQPRGFTISPPLPNGLSMDSLGVISGTPKKGSAATIYTVTARNDSGISSFDLKISVAFPAPITISSFTSKLNSNKTIQLNWQTTTETNTQSFTVQRSSNGIDFVNMTTLNAKRAGLYDFVDLSPIDGINYYRLQAIDNDGSVYFSSIISEMVSNTIIQLNIHPNPAKDVLHIQLNQALAGKYNIEIINILGKVLLRKQINCTEGVNEFSIPTTNFPDGNYILIVDGNKYLEQRFIIKNK